MQAGCQPLSGGGRVCQSGNGGVLVLRSTPQPSPLQHLEPTIVDRPRIPVMLASELERAIKLVIGGRYALAVSWTPAKSPRAGEPAGTYLIHLKDPTVQHGPLAEDAVPASVYEAARARALRYLEDEQQSAQVGYLPGKTE
jgi:hypothetical protein